MTEAARGARSTGTRLIGRVTTGRGEAAAFTSLEWARERFLAHLGIDPYPGTLNLLVGAAGLEAWSAMRAHGGYVIEPTDARFCAGRCWAVRVDDRLPAGIVVPDVPAYPPSQVEIVAAVPLRETLGVADGDAVAVDPIGPLRVRGLIFDVDGTLVDSLDAYRIVAERVAAPYGLTITDAMVREALNTTRPFWDIALPRDLTDRDATIAAMKAASLGLWADVLQEHGRLYAGVEDVLRQLRHRGATLGIFTNAWRRTTIGTLRSAGLLDLFDAVVTGADVARGKPDPEGLLLCAAQLGVTPDEAVYVGDTPLDVRAARAARIASVGVLGGAGDSALLTAAGADRLIASLGDLLDASRIVI